ncbi:hypothetical protein [Labilibaculum antarcticum]|uniref:Uncharacterized protein n=1 Tax=Labilibaculum antarcticum TaxID=1717717 RepID=A0A1Y1CQY3_9BACT|nr:hypothetical protein [Labilibaculum antarcticum]BAX82352.1 hypothetical protein ALGA_4061 [Labilibaculum antarcticum]
MSRIDNIEHNKNMIETLTELLNQPGVRKALDSPIVFKQVDRFKVFLSSIILKALNRWTLTLKKYLKWSNLILINLVVFSYFAGKANAQTLSEWISVISDFDVWWGYQIIVNIIYVTGRFLRGILVFCLRVAFIVLCFWLLYRIFVWLSNKLSSFFNDDIEEEKIELEKSLLEKTIE